MSETTGLYSITASIGSGRMGPKLKCRKCGDIIQSTHRHDFKWCKCKSVAIDGGNAYTRVVGNREDWEFVKEEGTEPCGCRK